MRRLKMTLSAIICAISLSACVSSGDYHHSAKNQVSTGFYAVVERVDKIKFKSHVGQGAAIGAADGFLHNIYGDADDRLFGAVVGAFFGALVTSIAEGDTNGFEFHLQDLNGEYLSVILDDKDASVGDCVIVTIAGEVYLTRQADHYCFEDF
jgi:outer membrane lipoprotein SlyB